MIPRETGRGWSISGARRVAAVERLVGATLVVALFRTAPPSAGHCLGTTEPGGRRLSRRTMRPRRAPTRGAPTIIGNWKFLRSPPPPGPRHDPARNWAGTVHQRGPPRRRCRTTRRGDPCGRPPPNGATVRRPLLGHYRTGGVERRLSSRRLGSASFRAPGMATWSGGVAWRHSWGTMRPRRAPTRGAPTVVGDWKFQRSVGFPIPALPA